MYGSGLRLFMGQGIPPTLTEAVLAQDSNLTPPQLPGDALRVEPRSRVLYDIT